MSDRPPVVIVVPAKGRSERVPHKNRRVVAGSPLWEIAAARGTAVAHSWPVRAVIVSTDDSEIHDAAVAAGYSVHWRTEAGLSMAATSAHEVVRSAVEWHSATSGVEVSTSDPVCMTLPTSPWLRWQSVAETIELAHRRGGAAKTVQAIRCAKILRVDWSGGWLAPVIEEGDDGEQLYISTGGAHVCPWGHLRDTGSMAMGDTAPYVVDAVEGLDIDYPAELELAQGIAAIRRIGGVP